MSDILFFIGHGTRHAHGAAEFLQLTSEVSRRVQAARPTDADTRSVVAGFLELIPPSLPNAVDIIQQLPDSPHRLLIVPLFLFAAGHIKHDIPEVLRRTVLSDICQDIQVCPPLGSDLPLRLAAASRALEAGFPRDPASTDGLLSLFRGSRDDGAYQESQCVARSLQRQLHAPHMVTAYLAGDGMRLEPAMMQLYHAGVRRIWLLPYLLFDGLLWQSLPQQTAAFVKQHPDMTVQIAHYLGLHEAVVDHVTAEVLRFLP